MASRKGRRGLAGLVSVAVIFMAVAWLARSSFSAGTYYRTVDEVMTEDGNDLIGQRFRIAGKVVLGSIVRAPGASPDYRFRVSDETGSIINVHYTKAAPDTFKDGVEVVVEGKLVSDDEFRATTLIAKCPSKYEGQLTPEDVARKEALKGAVMPAAPGPAPTY